MNDPHDLRRFVDAQNPVFEQVCSELRGGEKTGHWMWFIFPQLKGLGRSQMANRFGISSREEAEAYLAHPILGPRLTECSGLVGQAEKHSIEEIFGYPDNLKFLSSMTLFAHITADNKIFETIVQRYFGGQFDLETLRRMSLWRRQLP